MSTFIPSLSYRHTFQKTRCHDTNIPHYVWSFVGSVDPFSRETIPTHPFLTHLTQAYRIQPLFIRLPGGSHPALFYNSLSFRLRLLTSLCSRSSFGDPSTLAILYLAQVQLERVRAPSTPLSKTVPRELRAFKIDRSRVRGSATCSTSAWSRASASDTRYDHHDVPFRRVAASHRLVCPRVACGLISTSKRIIGNDSNPVPQCQASIKDRMKVSRVADVREFLARDLYGGCIL